MFYVEYFIYINHNIECIAREYTYDLEKAFNFKLDGTNIKISKDDSV